MFEKKFIVLLIVLVGILAVSSVSAADNATDDIVSISDDEAVSVEDTQNTSDSDESNVLKSEEETVLNADESSEGQILQSSVNNTVEVLSASNVSVKTNDVLGAVNPDSPNADPVLKVKKLKTVKMKVKYKWTTKKIGKYKIKARLWRVTYMGGYVNYLDIILYKYGKQVKRSAYLSKYLYKENGRWKWWSKWRHGGADHVYHRYINIHPIKMIKVKFRY